MVSVVKQDITVVPAKDNMKVVITSMYVNPIHPGHIECLEMARKLGVKNVDGLGAKIHNSNEFRNKG